MILSSSWPRSYFVCSRDLRNGQASGSVPWSRCPKGKAAKHFSREILSPRSRFLRYETLRCICLDVSEVLCQVGKVGTWRNRRHWNQANRVGTPCPLSRPL